jgi:hypothetical protein
MARALNDMIEGISLDQLREIEAQAARHIEEEMTLRDCSPHYDRRRASFRAERHVKAA